MKSPKLQDNAVNGFELSSLSKLESEGFEILDVPILQKADVILDTIGERARSELFFVETGLEDYDALRYDFTLAIASYYLEHFANSEPKLYAASGTVFRNREEPKRSELKQISFEYIGYDNPDKMDAECLATSLDLLSSFKDNDLYIEIADMGLSRSFLSSLDIPPIRQGRLKSALRQPKKFMSLLSADTINSQDNLSYLGKLSHTESEKVIKDIFTMTGIKHSGLRSMEEIRDRFIKKAEEAQEEQISNDVSLVLKQFYNLECPAEELTEKVRKITSIFDVNMDDVLNVFEKRLDILKDYNVDISKLSYGSLLKRKPEYYSGFMFLIETGENKTPIAGGGRYDDLFLSLGAKDPIPAIGCEIRPEEAMESYLSNT